jgi:hypothetical protein
VTTGSFSGPATTRTSAAQKSFYFDYHRQLSREGTVQIGEAGLIVENNLFRKIFGIEPRKKMPPKSFQKMDSCLQKPNAGSKATGQ